MRKFLQWLLKRPITWLADKVSSAPDKKDVFTSLTGLVNDIRAQKPERGAIIPFDLQTAKFVFVSDQHKGARDAADDFRLAEKNYRAALQHYFKENYLLINIGDCEELWENTAPVVVEKNRAVLLEEALFLQADRYCRTFGNHDLAWKYDIQTNMHLKPVFGEKLKVYEGIILETVYNGNIYSIFLTHGHQGDKRSDGNAFSMWFVAAIWTPIQRILEISVNTISSSNALVDRHNIIMYEWSATQKNTIFISGHTHKPVFASLDHIDRLNKLLDKATAANDASAIQSIRAELEKRKLEYAGKNIVKTMAHPSYFNTGCCCFRDGDITLIEIEADTIRLVKWKEESGQSVRQVLEESALSYILEQLG